MAVKLECFATTGLTLYAIITDPLTGNFWYTVTPAFEAYNAAHITSYAIALTEIGSGQYTANFPSAITQGDFTVSYRKQAGGSPATTDQVISTEVYPWDGITRPPRAERDRIYTTVNDLSASTTQFIGVSSLASSDGAYTDTLVVFLSGTNKGGPPVKVTNYTGSTRQFTVQSMLNAPANGDEFEIIGLITS